MHKACQLIPSSKNQSRSTSEETVVYTQQEMNECIKEFTSWMRVAAEWKVITIVHQENHFVRKPLYLDSLKGQNYALVTMKRNLFNKLKDIEHCRISRIRSDNHK